MDNNIFEKTAHVKVTIETALGKIIAEIFIRHAPITAEHFMRCVDGRVYDTAIFYRSARPDNDDRLPRITVIQGGIGPSDLLREQPYVAHETTLATGLRHSSGTLSMARGEPGTARSEFFIVVEDAPELDFGGTRNPDGQGFAAFGRVVEGMNIVREISARSTGQNVAFEEMGGQALLPPIPFQIHRRAPSESL